MNYMDYLNQFPPPGGQSEQPEWCRRRQIALLMILIGLALFIWSP